MIGFVDRVARNENQKKLEVVSLEYDLNGELIELIVNESRNDIVTEKGTKFNKSDMEKAIRDMIYSQVFSISFGDDTADVNIIAREVKTKTIDTPFYLEAPNANTEYSLSLASDQKSYTISVYSSVTKVSDIPYYINVYSDSQLNNFLFKITGVIHYSPSSTSSND